MKNLLGFYLKQYRKQKGVTMQVASDEIGITKSMLSLLETDKRNPSIKTAESLIAYYDIGRDSFYGEMLCYGQYNDG